MTSWASRPLSLAVPPEIFRFVTKAQQSVLEAQQTSHQGVERGRFWRAENGAESSA